MAKKIYFADKEILTTDNAYTKGQVDTLLQNKANTSDLASKQDALVSGINIKTINNQTILGGGNIEVQSGSSDYDSLTNTPIINQDLEAVGFTPASATYYRHTGAGNTYTTGTIYYYNGVDFKKVLVDVDTTPIQNSLNPISSGAVYDALQGIEAILATI